MEQDRYGGKERLGSEQQQNIADLQSRVFMRNDVFDVLPLVRYLGNSREALNSTRFIPFFIGMMLGILFGLIPFHIPGLSTPIRLGTSGGPLLTALLLSYRGSLGRIIFYTPTIVLNAFKEFGIILFLWTR